MIYITGDTHIPIDIQKLSAKRFPEQKNMTKNDYVIICGDFGGVWNSSNEEKYWIKWLKEKNFTTLFIDGNHENFDILNSLPTIEFSNGTVHKIDDNIYHLMRGEVYTIDGKKFFTFGGASSHDKEFRKQNINWWKDELPNKNEIKNAIKNLNSANWNVDYVITHCTSSSLQNKISNSYDVNLLTDFFDQLDEKLSYKKWFFGHYHLDMKISETQTCVFNDIILI